MALVRSGQEEHDADAVGRRMAESRTKLIVSYRQQLPAVSSSTLAGLLGYGFSIPGLSDWVRHNMVGLSTRARARIHVLLGKQDALSVNSAAYDVRQACKERDIFLCPDGEWLARIIGLDIDLVDKCYQDKGWRMPEIIREHIHRTSQTRQLVNALQSVHISDAAMKTFRDVGTQTQSDIRHRLLKENHRLKKLSSCKICLNEKLQIVFLPCRHLVACMVCGNSVKQCPICRRRILATIKVFFA
jgi:hypothetical protein